VKVEVVEGDLLDQDVDVIVNAWNRSIIPWWLLLPQGVSDAIKRRGGTGPFKELRKHGPIPLGGAVLTWAGRLPYKGIRDSASGFSSGPSTRHGAMAPSDSGSTRARRTILLHCRTT
jgi:O-acetyl-ADP-ribose deacetylase (regulator of RNase III)